MSQPDEVLTDGCLFNDAAEAGMFRRKVVPLERRDPPAIVEVDIVNGCAIMIRRDVIEQIGLIDEDFFIVHEESDFCLRAKYAGFRCGVIGEPLVWHKHSSAFAQAGKRWQRYYDARNSLLHRTAAPHDAARRGCNLGAKMAQTLYYYCCHEREAGLTDRPMSRRPFRRSFPTRRLCGAAAARATVAAGYSRASAPRPAVIAN